MNFVMANDKDQTKVLCTHCICAQEEAEQDCYNIMVKPITDLPYENCEAQA